jgi:hypothetical protein
MTAELNPYEPPSPPDLDQPDSKSAVVVETLGRRLLQVLVSCIGVIGFLALGALAIQQVLANQMRLAFLAGCASLMFIPMVDANSTIRQRFAASLLMPFALGGAVVLVALYFQLFRIRWFESVFNNDALGPLGLIAFALIGLVLGGACGLWVVKRCGFGDIK